jgi:hypothetical protein
VTFILDQTAKRGKGRGTVPLCLHPPKAEDTSPPGCESRMPLKSKSSFFVSVD